jgi:hypothetical protein
MKVGIFLDFMKIIMVKKYPYFTFWVIHHIPKDILKLEKKIILSW